METATSDRLNILHITYDMEIGGTEQVIRHLVSGLDKDRYSNSVLCINNKIGSMGIGLQNTGIKIFTLARHPGLDWSLVFALRKLIYDNNIDILHCHQYTPYTYGVIASLFTRKRVIYTEHGRFYPDRYSWKRRLINPLLNLATESVTAISKATKQALVHYEWFPEKSIGVIYNGIENSTEEANDAGLNHSGLRETIGICDNDIVLGTIARLDPIKNQTMMIDAFSLVQHSNEDTTLLIVGDGPERTNLENHVERLKLSDRVIFTGFKTNPKPYLEIIDVFLLSSLSEGTSMTLLEAMAAAKPCVVTDVGGNIEILDHGVNGLIVESGNARQFADAILSLIGDAALNLTISNNAKKKFRSNFDLRYMIESYQNLYEESRVQ